MAAIKNRNGLSGLKQNSSISKYVFFRDRSLRPFRCSLCLYKTTVLGLWVKHFMRNHQESLYMEPPAVQRQLNQYSLMAKARASPNVEETKLRESCLLHCDVCNFNTGHLSSMRRHYLNRHGKKILRCKDCSFFTGLRKTLEMHIEMGHSTCQSEPTHQKDLRCPFCLYQTKNKNNMIDHIVLHREERVVPIEVRRPKLSRYLQGLIFRCHKCTFTSGSLETLRLHTMKHDDIRPYKCRLCYFDCTHLSNLEAHLSDKHQVLRNHELVGQINLDQPLKIECLKEEIYSVSGSEDEDQDHHLQQKQEQEVEMVAEDDQKQGSHPEHREADGVKDILGGATPEGNPFTCQFCGRKLLNGSELERHIIRHRI
ncbi:zinc finger protein 462-like [Brachionichthys hirsutus]|uniref:zinc finger protein 462-like n=1 Tax=Brachionichthys hirsutus TaxID=412623 RepID=UPI003604E889